MTRKIKLENLAVINNIISKRQPENLIEILRQHCNKGRMGMLYSLKDLRPGSNEYIRIEEKRAEIMSFPDHNIKYTDDISILGEYSKEILNLTVGTYTVSETTIDYEGDEYTEDVVYTFLVKNQYHLNSVYLKFSDLFSEYNNISREWLEITVNNQYYKLRDSYKEEYQKYISLFKKDILKAFEYGYDVSIDSNRNMRGFNTGLYLKIEGSDKTIKHSLSMLDEILKIEYYWYEDKKMKFGHNYYFKDVLEEYEYAKDNVCE